VVIPPNCSATGATQATLVTTQISNNTPGSFIEYKVFRTDCQGNVVPLGPEKISFDLDATVRGLTPIPYALSSNGGVQTGSMNDIVGADLFGNAGPNFAHSETDQLVAIQGTSATTVVLRVAVPIPLVPRTGSVNMLATYLRFGDAAPVTKAVQLINN
jgi:hypothetical protein